VKKFTILLFVGTKPVGLVENVAAYTAKEASEVAVRRYRAAKELPSSFTIMTRAYEHELRVGDTISA
jgi:hypothetical protein